MAQVKLYTSDDLDRIVAASKYGDVGGSFELANDITWENPKPIGGYIYTDRYDQELYFSHFTGTFDGKGHTITFSAITANEGYYDYGWFYGLFGLTHDATIKNLHVSCEHVDGGRYSGVLIGYAHGNLNLYNCHVRTSSTNILGLFGGGLIGSWARDGVEDLNSIANGVKVKENDGAFARCLNVEYCSFSGNIYSGHVAGGGFIGRIGGSSNVLLKDCFVKSDISGYYSGAIVGGFIGSVHHNRVTMIRCVQVGSVEHVSGYLVGKTPEYNYIIGVGNYVQATPICDRGSGSDLGVQVGQSWTESAVYNLLERVADDGTTKASTTVGNERWGYSGNTAYPQMLGDNKGYTVKVSKGSNIETLTTDNGYENSDGTITATVSIGSEQRLEGFRYTGQYNPSYSNEAYKEVSSTATSWTINPLADGTVSAEIVTVPYPKNPTVEWDQWSKTMMLTWTRNDPDRLSGQYFIYKRVKTDSDWSNWELDTEHEVDGDVYKLGTHITLDNADLNKTHQYQISFVDGQEPDAPATPPSGLYSITTAEIKATATVDLSSFSVTSEQEGAVIRFTTDSRIPNSSEFRYTIQRTTDEPTATDAVWADMDGPHQFDGRADEYTYTDNTADNNCTTYTYRLAVSAFGGVLYSNIYTGRMMDMTSFYANKPLVISKGEYPTYVRLNWKVNATNRIFRVFRRVANSGNEFDELETVTSTAENTYWNDVNAMTGVYYEYKVVLYQDCPGVSGQVLTELDNKTGIGFTQAFGNMSGRITFGTGNAVENVKVIVKRNDMQEGDNQYHSLFAEGGGQKFEWADSTRFNAVWTGNSYTYQFWLNPSISTSIPVGGNIVIGKFGKNAILLSGAGTNTYRVNMGGASSEAIPANHFSHISIVNNEGSLSIYTVVDTNPDSIYIRHSAAVAVEAPSKLPAADARLSLGHTFRGNFDDVRLWGKALTEAEIMRDYSRIILGNESGLKAYWNFDEGIDGYAFDMSRVGTVFNGNHATAMTLKPSTDIPVDTYQLALKGVTDINGNYTVGGIPFSGEGTSYSAVPTLGVHQFNPTEQTRYVSQQSMVHNGTDFTDVSSFKVSGTVTYKGGTYPVSGCSFMIDDRPVTLASGQPVLSNIDGTFELSVPIGIHKLQIGKNGHTFANNGLLLEVDGSNHNYNAPVANVKFQDLTKVKIVGRVTGGTTENNKPLGFGESKNNIGVGSFKLSSTMTQYDFVDNSYDTTVNHNNGEWHRPNAPLRQDTSVTTYDKKEITITVSPTTGEYVAYVYPEPYNIGSIVIPAREGTRSIHESSEMIDLSSAAQSDPAYWTTSTRTWLDSTVVKGVPGVVDHTEYFENSDTVRYQGSWKYFWQEPAPTLSVRQIAILGGDTTVLPYFGESDFLIDDKLTGNKDTVHLWLNDDYTFGKPLFVQGHEYTFGMTAYERYINYADQAAPDTTDYPVSGGKVTMNNAIKGSNDVIELDSLGTATYTFAAGAPDLTTGINNFSATMAIGSISYYWDFPGPIEAWHLGSKISGTDFMTSGPDKILAVLRDPPGSNSYSYYEEGTTSTVSETYELADGVDAMFKTTISAGADIVTWFGFGGGTIIEASVTADAGLGMETSMRYSALQESSISNTFTEKFNTSSDPNYVGSVGDLFVGVSTNLQYGLTDGVTIRKGVDPTKVDTFITKGDYSIAKAGGFAYGPKFATKFVYTQSDIENVKIPQWRDNIANYLKDVGTKVDRNLITSPVYVSKLLASEPNYGKVNIDRKAFPEWTGNDPYDGPSYKIYFPSTWATDTAKMRNFVDSVVWANNQISTWEAVLAQNEKEKLGMTDIENYSFGGGATIDRSKTGTTSSSFTNTVFVALNPFISATAGAEVLGIGVSLETESKIVLENSQSSGKSQEKTLTTGFVLDEGGSSDMISVDYGNTPSGVAFKSRGGRTSCPYEGEELTKYFEPGQHVLNEGSMRMEVPVISLASNSSVLGVPSNNTARFAIDLKNESETGDDQWYQLSVDESTNPNGAVIKVDGGSIGSGKLYMVKAGETLRKEVTIGKGSVDRYDNIRLVLSSTCQNDPTDYLAEIADTVSLSVEFVPACSEVAIDYPRQNWIVNCESVTGDELNITLTGFDRNMPNFGYIMLEYRPVGSPTWTSIRKYYPDALFAKAQEANKENIGTRTVLNYSWKMPSTDGAYELRATTASVNSADGAIIGDPLSTYTTEGVVGYKDMSKPKALGAPSPVNGIMGAGDELSIVFNEDIQTGMLTANNFTISGVLNAQEIAEPNVGLAFAGSTSARTELPIFTNGSFSIETWFRHETNNAGTLFAYGQNENYISLGIDAEGHAVVTVGNAPPAVSAKAISIDETWKFIALTFNRKDSTVCVYEYEGDTNNELIVNRKFAVVPEEQGTMIVGNNHKLSDGFEGALAYLHFYGTERPEANIAAGKSVTKTGREYGLIGYWPMDEGEGNLAVDKARSRNLALSTDWYIYPSGLGAEFTGSTYLTIPTDKYPLDALSDFTLEFWFNAASQTNTTLFSCNSGHIGFDATGRLVLYKYDGKVNQTLAAAGLTDNQWHHFALSVKRGGTAKVYIDGLNTVNFAEAGIGAFGSANYYFGGRLTLPTNVDNFFTGAIDEIRIWRGALTTDGIKLNKNSKLTGREAGLMAYYPFETYTQSSGGLVSVVSTLNNMDIVPASESGKSTDLPSIEVAGGTAVTGSAHASIKEARRVEEVPFTFVASDNKVVLTIKDDYFARVEGVTLSLTADGIIDTRNNESDLISWTAFINRNPLRWASDPVNLVVEQGKQATFTARIVNNGGVSVNYAIENLPDYLTVNAPSGSLQPLESRELTFTVVEGTNIGSYETGLELTSGNGITESLGCQLKLSGKRPDWKVTPANYQSTMTIVGQIKIEGIIQEDTEDLLAAFVDGHCVGVNSPTSFERLNSVITYLTVYGNAADKGKPVTLKYWDASTGIIYSNIVSTLAEETQSFVFAANKNYGDPLVPVSHNVTDATEMNISLSKGWNWISTNLASTSPALLSQITSQLGSTAEQIKGQNGYLEQGVGSLTEIDVKQMYMLETSEATDLTLSGSPVDVATTAMTLYPGWNWISYLPQVNQPIEAALAGFTPANGDQIKSRTGFSTYVSSAGWIGNLTYLQPGEGYLYNSIAEGNVEFNYPAGTAQRSSFAISPLAAPALHYTYDNRRFANTMTATVYVTINGTEITSDQLEVAAFVGNECRGSVTLQAVEGFDHPYLGFLQIFGNDGEALVIKLYDHVTGTEYSDVKPQLTFTTNDKQGRPDAPLQVYVGSQQGGTTAVGDETTTAHMTVYPNPTSGELRIRNYELRAGDVIELYNAAGKLVAIFTATGPETTISLDGLAAGTYVVSVPHIDATAKIVKQ